LSRFYTLVIERDLFGQVVLVRSWGRIGAWGREIVEPYLDELEAGAALERIAARKRRRGYRDL
ncbi:MAG TPA: WGR domain-containing protein, partial [Gemmatimonadales bacterium]|nr:WGR domain-containing protein [Gemmatimonadales bacterium]